MKRLTAMLAAVALLISQAALAIADPASKGWWDDTPWQNPDRGFNWYPPDAPPVKKDKKTEAKPKSIREMTTMQDLQKELARLKDLAIMQPSTANVKAYLEAQTYVMDKSSVFADTARRVVWATPSVDYNNRSPVANFARISQQQNRLDDERRVIAELRKDYAVAFFFRSDCPHCHNQAPIIKLLESQYGMRILAISLDSRPMSQFPEARPDNGISMLLTGGQGVQTVPALYLVDRRTQSGIPLGTGALALDEILTRIRVLTQTAPGQDF